MNNQEQKLQLSICQAQVISSNLQIWLKEKLESRDIYVIKNGKFHVLVYSIKLWMYLGIWENIRTLRNLDRVQLSPSTTFHALPVFNDGAYQTMKHSLNSSIELSKSILLTSENWFFILIHFYFSTNNSTATNVLHEPLHSSVNLFHVFNQGSSVIVPKSLKSCGCRVFTTTHLYQDFKAIAKKW